MVGAFLMLGEIRAIFIKILTFSTEGLLYLNDVEVENLSRCKNFTLNMGRGSNYVETYSIILAIIVGFICTGIFADDFQTKADAVFFSTKYGRTKAVKTKILAGIVTTVMIYCMGIILLSVICFGIMGTSGMDTPYQMYQAYSIYILSYGQYYLLTVVCGFIASMLAASVSMLVAAKMHTISVAICIPFFSFSDQVSWISDEKGIRIKDREYAEVMLRQIGYFPLMGGYKHLFHTPSARYYFSFSVSSIKAVIIFVSWPAALTPAFLQAAA